MKKNIIISILIVLSIGLGSYMYLYSRKNISVEPVTTPDDTPTQSTQNTDDEVSVNFEETGNLTRNIPGQPENVWLLIYERPGAPALTVELEFISKSECFNPERVSCDQIKLNIGDRASVKGNKQNNKVVASTLEIL